MINCDRCQGPTRPKKITKRATGESWDVLECIGTCRSLKNPKYSYTFFPPSEPAVPSIQVREPQGNGEVVNLLEEILFELKSLNQQFAKQTGQIHVSKQELEPDSEVPF